MKTSREAPPDLARLLQGVDWSRCSGRDLHRLAEGAAQAAVRSRVVGLEGEPLGAPPVPDFLGFFGLR